MLLLLSCFIITGVTAVSQPTTHYQETGNSFCLQVGISPPSPYQDVRWTYNEEAVVFNKKLLHNYIEKMHYNKSNHSLCITRLREIDSGHYKVTIIDSNFKEAVENHQLIVQAPVPKPVIKMSLRSPSSNLSAGICELSVTCSVLGDWSLAFCNQDGCRTSDGFYSKVNITISTHNSSVVCSGKNHVSKQSASEDTEKTCYSESNKKPNTTSHPFNAKVIVIAVVFGVILFAFVAYVAVRLCSVKYNINQTSTAQEIQSQTVKPATRDSTSSTSQPEASYENVDATQPPMSSPTVSPLEELESKQSCTVDTVYSVLQLPRGNDSHGKSDRGSTKDHEVIEVASPSESGEAKYHIQVDTVHSMVQKPQT